MQEQRVADFLIHYAVELINQGLNAVAKEDSKGSSDDSDRSTALVVSH